MYVLTPVARDPGLLFLVVSDRAGETRAIRHLLSKRQTRWMLSVKHRLQALPSLIHLHRHSKHYLLDRAIRLNSKEKSICFKKMRELFSYATRTGVIVVVLVLGALIFGGYAASAPKPGGALPAAAKKDHVYTQVLQHTYDEVFQAVQETIEREGLFVTNTDKDKGTLGAKSSSGKWTFDIHVETLNAKPETQVTVVVRYPGLLLGSDYDREAQKLLAELQKVLSTYR